MGWGKGRLDGSSEKSPEASCTASVANWYIQHTSCVLLLTALVCIDTYHKESCQESRNIEGLHLNLQSNNRLVKLRQFWGKVELTASLEGVEAQGPDVQPALPKLEEHCAAPAFSAVKITLPAPCQINENAAGDWGYQLRNTQDCYLLTERGHFSASNLQLRRCAGLRVGPRM